MSEHSYTIYEPKRVNRNLVDRADELVFVRDGFSWWAALAPILWMIYHRLWMPLAGFGLAFLALSILAWLAGAGEGAGGLLLTGLSLAFGFVANDVRRFMLEREDFTLVSAIAGFSQLDCERRFFDNWAVLNDKLQNEGSS